MSTYRLPSNIEEMISIMDKQAKEKSELRDACTVFRLAIRKAHEQHCCILCGASIRDERGEHADCTGENGQIYSNAGLRGWRESGICETCQDCMEA